MGGVFMKKIARIFICLILIGTILETHVSDTVTTDHFSRLTTLAIDSVKTAVKPVISMMHEQEQVSQAVRESIACLGDIVVYHAPILWNRVIIALKYITTQIEYGAVPVKGFFESVTKQLS